MTEPSLSGRWRRGTAAPPPFDPEAVPFGQDASQFPGEIEFTGVRYRAEKSPGQPFIVWDVGTFELGDDELTMTLANDASATYRIELHGDEFTLTDVLGQRTTYQRSS